MHTKESRGQHGDSMKITCLGIGDRGILENGQGYDKDVFIQEKLILLLRRAEWKGRKRFERYVLMQEFKEDFLHLSGNRQDIAAYIRQAEKRRMKYCILPCFSGRRNSVYLMVSFYDIPLYLSLLECDAMKKRKAALFPTTARNYFSEGYAEGGREFLRKLEKSANQNLRTYTERQNEMR